MSWAISIPGGFSLSLPSWNIIAYMLISAIGIALGLGYALPLLLEQFSPLTSAAIVGVFIVLYKGLISIHDPNIGIMSVGLFAIVFLAVGLYRHTMYTSLAATVFFFLYVCVPNMVTYPMAALSGNVLPIYISKIVYLIIAIAIVVLFRSYYMGTTSGVIEEPEATADY